MRSVIATVAVAIVLIILAGAVFIYSGAYYVGADQAHWSVTSWLLNEARNRSTGHMRRVSSFLLDLTTALKSSSV